MPYFFIRFLQKTLLPSMMAAFLPRTEGTGCPRPPARPPCRAPAGRPARPRQNQRRVLLGKGHHARRCRLADDGNALGVGGDAAVAGRAPDRRSTLGLFFSVRTMACSRPPPPITRIFISVLLDFLALISAAQRKADLARQSGVCVCCFSDGTAAMPENAITMPYLLAVSMTCRRGWSRPALRCTVTPDWRARSTLSPKGKKASLPTVTPVRACDPGASFPRRSDGAGCSVKVSATRRRQHVLLLVGGVDVDGVVAVGTADVVEELQRQHLRMLAQLPVVGLVARQTGAVDAALLARAHADGLAVLARSRRSWTGCT